jgi:hypothetical protein
MPEALDVPECPAELEYLWGYFLDMSRKRTSGAMSANPLSDEQIMAWQRRRGIRFTPLEDECIDLLDVVYLGHVAEKEKS